MKHVYPMNDEVRWDPAEKVIGVVGVAPYATLDFCQKIVRHTPASKDWHHVRTIVDSNPKIPSRGRHIELGETDPTPHIRESILELHRFGADFVVIPCNTAHYFYDGFSRDLEVAVPNMLEATCDLLRRDHPDVRRAGILGSRTTTVHRLYDRFLEPLDIEPVYAIDHQDRVSALIEDLKVGRTGSPAQTVFGTLVEDLAERGAEAVILGCTELSLLVPESPRIPVVDSNESLARSCVELVFGRPVVPE